MHVIEKRLRNAKLNPLGYIGGAFLIGSLFVTMGLALLDVKYVKQKEPEPLFEFHLPPPPPPPSMEEPPPKKKSVSINFNLPATSEPTAVPIGFLEVGFGLSPKVFTQSDINVDNTINNYQTDGLEEITVYDYRDVSKPPVRTYKPSLNIPGKKIGNTKRPFSVSYIALIDSKGIPVEVYIFDCPYPEVIPDFVAWIKSFRYKPAKKDGREVSCTIRRKVTYRPSTSSPFSL